MKKVFLKWMFITLLFYHPETLMAQIFLPADDLSAVAIVSHNLHDDIDAVTAPPDDKTKKVLWSAATDYFRSVQGGSWALLATWESSPDNMTWSAATLIPDENANTIFIRNTHTVTVFSPRVMDQVIIESGGVLHHVGSSLIINDGPGDDVIVQSGGVFLLASNGNGPMFWTTTATANINTGGTLRLSALGLTGAGAGVNASNYIYQHASVLEYTMGTPFSSTSVTYFPNVDAVTIPVFRTTTNVGLVGSTSFTVINGLFEANGNISFQFSGTKTFRNGITGTGNVNGATSGNFIINGATASLGGTGVLTLPTATGMNIGNTTTVNMVSAKSVVGNITLLTNALVVLNNFNLTMTGNISGGSVTSHVVTNGTGKLVVNNIGAGAVVFPIGVDATSINQLSIANGNNFNYGARVEAGINPPIRFPIASINRTWVVQSSANSVGPADLVFFYNNTDGNALFNYSDPVEHGFYTAAWNVINTGLIQFGGPLTYIVTAPVNIFAANVDAPMVIANIPAILQPGNSITLQAKKQLNHAWLNWTFLSNITVKHFVLERSNGNGLFVVLKDLPAAAAEFTDLQLLPGINYYRIKMIDAQGGETISNTVSILNANKGFEIMNIAPNPVTNNSFDLKISSARKTSMQIIITDMQGRLMQKQIIMLDAGFNTKQIPVEKLAAGIYQLYGNTDEGRLKPLRFVKQ